MEYDRAVVVAGGVVVFAAVRLEIAVFVLMFGLGR